MTARTSASPSDTPVSSRRPRRAWRWARRLLLGSALLATLVVALYVIEGWRGRRAWAEVEALARRSGETLDYAAFIPPPVPEAENFAATPAVAAWFGADPVLAATVAAAWELPATWDRAARLPLPAAELLAALEPQTVPMEEIVAASHRPQVRFPLRFEDGFAMSLPHLRPLRAVARRLALRAEARLELGQTAAAAADVAAIFRLGRVMQQSPTLIGYLVGQSINSVGVSTLKSGLRAGAWTAADLAVLERDLAPIDGLASCWAALRMEQASALTLLRALAEAPQGNLAAFALGDASSGADLTSAFRFAPSGWIFQNMAVIARLYLEQLLPAFDPVARRVDLAQLQAVGPALTSESRSPYTVLARVMLPAVETILVRAVQAQTEIDLARHALALEGWRLAHGSFPATLAELTAAAPHLAALHDLVTGEPLRYRPAESGGILLYATGPDGRDEGGIAAREGTAGDWVWSTAAPPAPR